MKLYSLHSTIRNMKVQEVQEDNCLSLLLLHNILFITYLSGQHHVQEANCASLLLHHMLLFLAYQKSIQNIQNSTAHGILLPRQGLSPKCHHHQISLIKESRKTNDLRTNRRIIAYIMTLIIISKLYYEYVALTIQPKL